MAINDVLPGVEVTIAVDGQPLREYIDANQEEDDKTVTRYIEAKAGQKFSVVMKTSRNVKFLGDILTFCISIDGQRVDKSTRGKAEVLAQAFKVNISEGLRVSPTKLLPYCFANLETGMLKAIALP